MGPLAILSILSVAAPIIGGVIKTETAIKEGRENLETVRVLESYRYHPRKELVVPIAERLPGRARFLAPALASAKTQWQRDMAVGIIEMELYRD